VVSSAFSTETAVDVAIANSRVRDASWRGNMPPKIVYRPPFITRHLRNDKNQRRVLRDSVEYNLTLKTKYLNRKDGVEDDIPELACGQDVSSVKSTRRFALETYLSHRSPVRSFCSGVQGDTSSPPSGKRGVSCDVKHNACSRRRRLCASEQTTRSI